MYFNWCFKIETGYFMSIKMADFILYSVFFIIFIFFFFIFYRNSSGSLSGSSSGSSLGESDGSLSKVDGSSSEPDGSNDPDNPKKNKKFWFFIFLLISGIISVIIIILVIMAFHKSVVFHDLFGNVISPDKVVLNRVPLPGEYAPFSFWEELFMIYVPRPTSEEVINSFKSIRDTFVLSGDEFREFVIFFGGSIPKR
jgi:uncharacterized integral membrane protein